MSHFAARHGEASSFLEAELYQAAVGSLGVSSYAQDVLAICSEAKRMREVRLSIELQASGSIHPADLE
ncbi:hypothetical protein [Bradyrhizobium sp.]|jgi:hypothetical protein|uniref:hypothetical protein n=1 Tax=Bradyrhizobium sp. TaxID=376 RepID=UPI003BB02901